MLARIKPPMKTWRRPLRLIFIGVFLLAVAVEFILHREDWPFSHFGMYSEYISEREICRYEIQMLFDGEQRSTHIYHFDWLIDILLNQADCRFYVQGNKEDFQNRFGALLEREGRQIAEHYRGKSRRVHLFVRVLYWESLTAENLKKPEQVNELYSKEFPID